MKPEKMTRKRFRKLMMSRGVSRNAAQWLIDYLTEQRHAIDAPWKLVLRVDAETNQCCTVKAYPYAQIYKSFVEDGELLV